MNVLSITRSRSPVDVPPPLNFSFDIYSFTSCNAPSTRTSSALNRAPSPIFWPLRESWDPVLAIVFLPSFITFSGALAFGIEDNTEIFSLSFLVAASISACVNSRLLLLSTLLAFSKSAWIAARVEAGAFSLLTLSKSSWTFVILACNWDLSNVCFSTTLSEAGVSFSDEALLFDLLFRGSFSTASLFSAGFSVSLATSTFSVSLVSSFFDVGAGSIRGDSSSFGFGAPMAGWFWWSTPSALTTCVPKNISAATATEAAPKLYLRIEYLKTLSLWWRLIRLNDLFLCSMFPPKGNLI